MSDALSRSFREVDVETSVDNGRLMAYLAAHGEILSQLTATAVSRSTAGCPRIPGTHPGHGTSGPPSRRPPNASAALDDVA